MKVTNFNKCNQLWLTYLKISNKLNHEKIMDNPA